ncbi:transmembrane protein 127-like [Haliotis rufescens]|uniref:transmembrane protein 127-like n=1 Tax=Haliotis rufescens TaxID=6454 RepID=UPI00201F87D0|nr:transmembrane protein 127-like [Haliotis rufescens]
MPSSTSTSRSSGRNREGGTRRNRSRVRSRTRHRESRSHSQSQSQSRFRFKLKERNYPAAVCSMITIVLLCVSMAEPRWISLRGGGCSLADTKNGYLHSLGVNQFFYSGKLVTMQSDKSIHYHFGPDPDEVLINCVDSKSVLLFKIVIFFSFLTIMICMASFLLDLTGPSGRVLQRFHRNAIFSIITVTLCVVINLFCYWISFLVEQIQKKTKQDHVEVTFDISFYLVAAAGSASVFAVACNCFRRYPLHEDVSYQRLNECDDMESLAAMYDQQTAPPPNVSPPPYSPSPNTPAAGVTPAPQESAAAQSLSVSA